jgi:FkbM family methyltransferase
LGGGLWLRIDPHYELDYLRGRHEPLIQGVLRKQLARGATFYDVGAHIGFLSLLAAKLVGEEGAVFSFEPDPENAERIREHALQNALNQVSVVQAAAWSQSGILPFERCSEFSSRNTGGVAVTRSGSLQQTIIVEALTLDEFAERHRPPALIKIDVEGGEAEVLKGATRLLTHVRPVLSCEIHNERAQTLIEQQLEQVDYSSRWLTPRSGFPCHVLAHPRGCGTRPVDGVEPC